VTVCAAHHKPRPTDGNSRPSTILIATPLTSVTKTVETAIKRIARTGVNGRFLTSRLSLQQFMTPP
jgi:hypothetical protein